ncbi:MAG: hypothetical protein SGILL_000699 [Bacillariaceae sp.]
MPTLAFNVLPKFSNNLSRCHQKNIDKRDNISALSMAKKKGFGTQPPPQKKKPPPQPSTPRTYDEANDITATAADYKPPAPGTESSKSDTSQGKVALERMIRERAEQRNAELEQIRQVQRADEQVKEAPAAIPEKVAQRMGKRMLPFVGIPLFGSMISFIGFWYMATYQDLEFQPVLVATTSLVFLVVGIVGITYSIMSASWDDDREGSLLGTEEFSQNLGNIKSGLSRSKENAILRDKMDSGMYSQADLEKVGQENKKPASFSEKMGEEMD